MANDKLKIGGRLQVVLKDKDGNVKEERDIKNLVVTAGLDHITACMAVGDTAMNWVGVGTGATAAAAGNTDVETHVAPKVVCDSVTDNGGNIVYVTTFGAGVCTGALTEAGIFNSITAATGDMLARTVFSVVNKGASDTLVLTWTVTISV